MKLSEVERGAMLRFPDRPDYIEVLAWTDVAFPSQRGFVPCMYYTGPQGAGVVFLREDTECDLAAPSFAEFAALVRRN